MFLPVLNAAIPFSVYFTPIWHGTIFVSVAFINPVMKPGNSLFSFSYESNSKILFQNWSRHKISIYMLSTTWLIILCLHAHLIYINFNSVTYFLYLGYASIDEQGYWLWFCCWYLEFGMHYYWDVYRKTALVWFRRGSFSCTLLVICG